MPKPIELRDVDIAVIAFKVRSRLEELYDMDQVHAYFSEPMCFDLLKEIYIAVREQIEAEDA